MIQVHHLEKSRSSRILWLLEELGVEYEIKVYHRDPKTYGAPESLKKIHPLGKSPIITDGNLTIAESGAIIEYLIDQYDEANRLRPLSGQALIDYRYWLHFAEGSLMPLLVMRLVLNMAKSKPMPFFIKPIIAKFIAALESLFIAPRLTPQLEMIDAYLKQHQWFAGDKLSGADIQMMLSLQLAQTRCDLSKYANIIAYMSRCEHLPNWQKAYQREQNLE